MVDPEIPMEIQKIISDLLNDPDVCDICITADRISDTKNY